MNYMCPSEDKNGLNGFVQDVHHDPYGILLMSQIQVRISNFTCINKKY